MPVSIHGWLGGFGWLLLAGPLLAQDPWSRVPALPTGCYFLTDNFDEDVEALRGALADAANTQREKNSEAREKFKSMDPSEQQARLMAFMQKNPASAQRIFSQMQAVSSEAAGDPATLEKERQHLEQLKQARTAYQADYEKQLAAHLKVFRATLEDKSTQGQVDGAYAGFNRDYPALCKKWFSPARLPNGTREGQFLKGLERYQAFLRNDWTKMMDTKELADREFLEAMGISMTGVASTAAMEAVQKYLAEVEPTYRKREDKPRTP